MLTTEFKTTENLDILTKMVVDELKWLEEEFDDMDIITYYSETLEEKSKSALVKLDIFLNENFQTAEGVYKWFTEKAGSNISLERADNLDGVDLDDFEPHQRLDVLESIMGEQFQYLTAMSMMGQGVGWFEMFDAEVPDLLYIC